MFTANLPCRSVERSESRFHSITSSHFEREIVTSPPLQPLRIPAGWLVQYNNAFYEIEPDVNTVSATDCWWIFKEDMLQLAHARHYRLLDLGWYPEGDLVNGCYRAVVHEGDFHGPELHSFESRDRHALVAEIERALLAVNNGEL